MGMRVLLHKTPRPGHHSQCDFILLQLQHGDERRVVHPHCCGSVYRHYLITTLEASVKMSRRARHNGFDEERLLAVALFIAPDNTEAPALVVGLLQDDVPAPVHVTR